MEILIGIIVLFVAIILFCVIFGVTVWIAGTILEFVIDGLDNLLWRITGGKARGIAANQENEKLKAAYLEAYSKPNIFKDTK